ncbi:MAG TPA: hypothetical protein VGA38_02600 [Candidatus Limnocylindria bacterium]
MREQIIGHVYRTQSQALARCEPSPLQPLIEDAVVDLEPIELAPEAGVVDPELRLSADTPHQRFDELAVLTDERYRAAALDETTIRGDEANCIRHVRCPVE